jgi:soluble lytic murein transglycosylase
MALAIAGFAAISAGILSLWHTKQSHLEQPSAPFPAQFPAQPFQAPLYALAPHQRAEQLETLIRSHTATDRYRAKYLRACDLIALNRPQAAIALLDGLEKDYPLLAPAIVIKRAEAYALGGQLQQAQALWQEAIRQYPHSPIIVEAFYGLGKAQPRYWQQAIAQFPAHPRTVEIAQHLLAAKKTPNSQQVRQSPDLLGLQLLIARYGIDTPDIVPFLDQVVEQQAKSLKPADWEAIAFAYWENLAYKQAGQAYAKAPATPQNCYRAGRGLQIGDEKQLAKQTYRQTIQAFPDAPETALALTRLSDLVDPEAALTYLDQVIARFPDKAAEALAKKAINLDALDRTKAATQTRQTLLSQYGQSESAAELRWDRAEQAAAQRRWQVATDWAQGLLEYNPDSDLAPEAGFWLGKWATQMNQPELARSAYKKVLSRYPESYYAWRSAGQLGLEVGDFHTVRYLLPQIQVPRGRSPLPTGSPLLQELYQLGQDRDAWSLWQVEFQNRVNPTVAEQFADGMLRLGVGDNLDGIFMLASLESRENPDERSQYQTLRQQPAYWYGLYPLPFGTVIAQWSRARQLNPLLVTALIRQESRFEPSIRSVSDAMGLMQIIPETADWVAQNLQLKTYRLENPEDNIQLGTWYLDYTHREYSNNSMLAVASYNAGPGNVADWIKRFQLRDEDQFVEQIPFPETKGYVEAVFANYWNYKRLYDPKMSQLVARYSPVHQHLFQAANSQHSGQWTETSHSAP